MINKPEWTTHTAWLYGQKIYTDFNRMVFADSGKIERVDRSELYAMRVERENETK